MQALKRIRGRRWMTIRAAFLGAHPLCVICQAAGRLVAATELDHIVALCNGGGNNDGNYQALCHGCHSMKTAQDKGYIYRTQTGLDGWPL